MAGVTWPLAHVEHVQDTAPARKLRLFGCGCSRRVWNLTTSDRGRTAVETAERFADGNATREELFEAYFAVNTFIQNCSSLGTSQRDNDFAMIHALQAGMCPASEEVASACWDASTEATKAVRAAKRASGENGNAVGPERELQAALFRDIFGNPFVPLHSFAGGGPQTFSALPVQSPKSGRLSGCRSSPMC